MAGYSNSYSNSRRRQPGRNRGRNQPQPGDVITSAITLQVILCLLVIVFFVVYKQANEERYQVIKTEYTAMTNSDAGSGALGAVLSGAAEGITNGLQSVEDFFANLARGLLGRETPSPETSTPEEESESEAPVNQFQYNYLDEELVYTAALPVGGFFPVEEEKAATKEPPSGSTMAPIFLSAPVKPPVTGIISSLFGYRTHPITETSDFHTGMDIAAEEGRAILSCLPGVVAETGESQIYGNYIIIRHAENLETFYAHCSELIAATGMVVRQGERIAKVGKTGLTTGPHLHFSVIVAEQFTDPYWVLKNSIEPLE